MKVHITLVGSQSAPVHNGIVYADPDKVIFIYSNETCEVADRVVGELRIPSEKRRLDPVDLTAIEKEALRCGQDFADDEISVNISGGTKPWSYFFAKVFGDMPNAMVFYVDQNNVLWNFKTKTKQEGIGFNMQVQLKLYGNPLKEGNYRNFSDYNEEDQKAAADIERIRLFNVDDFNALTAVLDSKRKNILKNQPSGKFDLLKAPKPSNSFVEWAKPKSDFQGFVRICLFKKDGRCQELLIESPNAIDLAFNSGWFEYKVAALLSKWNKVKEICLNCRFPFRENLDKNETDIIVNTGAKLLFVECKTQITHTTDIDKFRSVVKEYGGTGSKGLFVTDAKMSDVARAKCKENSILSFSLHDEHLGMSPEQALFFVLENELYNINPK